MNKTLKTCIKAIGYFALYAAVPVARAAGLDFGELETDIEETIDGSRKIIISVAFVAALGTYLVTKSAKAMVFFAVLIFFIAQGLNIALGYVGLN
jgi:hypothetical protein